MKNLVLVFFAFLSFSVFSQDIKYSDLIDNNVKKNTLKAYKSYLSKDDLYFKSGDTIQAGISSSDREFAYINLQGSETVQLKKSESGIKMIIVNFWIVGSKKTGYQAEAICKTGLWTTKYHVILENAIASGEIKTSLLTSDDALAKLKKAKEKLDLGLITQEEFDKLKSELKKYVK
jgi:hypothetical protein